MPFSRKPRNAPTGRNLVCLAALCVFLGLMPQTAAAYIGPGAGFAVGTTLVTLFVAFFSTLAALLVWPFRWLVRFVRQRRAHARARVKRVVVLGLDGLDPTLTEQYMAAGKLPNFARLKQTGCYCRLATTAPAMTPVAWASFLTGCNPGKHNVFDFLTRDKRTYLPMLSSAHIAPPRKTLRLGRYRLPLGGPDVRRLRKGTPFWHLLGEHGIFSCIIRMPITFPPEKFRGLLLSAMCVPDLRGSQGTFSYYSTNGVSEEHEGGEQIRVRVEGELVRSHLVGPPNTLVEGAGPLRCPFTIRITGEETATLKVCGQTLKLRRWQYTPWVTVEFRAAPGIKVRGICQFLLLETRPNFRLYVTPIQIDPRRPALPIAHPNMYAAYLARLLGPYATLGLAEDTWGLNAGVLDDETFLHQVLEADNERVAMFFDALEKVRQGLCVCVVDGPDRVHHMFWRYIDPQHPARNGKHAPCRPAAIEEMYVRMDQLVGQTLERIRDRDTLLLVVSDHGCVSFRRGIDLNYWLEQNGYLKLKPDGRGKKYLAGVDWSATRAYCVGLTGIWLNLRGREARGIVAPEEAPALRAELVRKLSGLKDDQTGEVAIERVLDAHQIYRGPYVAEAPDLIVGYRPGYRVCWEAAIGQPTERLFHDNTKAWSGDHIVDPQFVPGVLFANRRILADRPHIADLGPTILDLFGVAVPGHMDGRPLNVADDRGAGASAGERGEDGKA